MGGGDQRGRRPRRVDTIDCGGETPGVALFEPPRRPMRTPGLSDPSGSDLRVVSHGISRLLVGGIYSGLYLGRVSSDVAHSDALVLTFFDGITRRAMAVDLHFFSSSYNGSV